MAVSRHMKGSPLHCSLQPRRGSYHPGDTVVVDVQVLTEHHVCSAGSPHPRAYPAFCLPLLECFAEGAAYTGRVLGSERRCACGAHRPADRAQVHRAHGSELGVSGVGRRCRAAPAQGGPQGFPAAATCRRAVLRAAPGSAARQSPALRLQVQFDVPDTAPWPVQPAAATAGHTRRAIVPHGRTRLPDNLPPSFLGTAVQYSYILEARVQTSASSPLNQVSRAELHMLQSLHMTCTAGMRACVQSGAAV